MPPVPNKPTEVVRIEYNVFGEREKVTKIIPDPRSTLRSRPTCKSDSTRRELSASHPPPPCKGADETVTRLEHTTNILRELLLGKISRDEHTGIHSSMINVAREYFRVAFGATEVAKKKMAALAETIFELKKHSSFLRIMGRSLIHPEMQAGLSPGQSAVFFSAWSLLVEKTRTSEADFVVETLPLSSFLQIFNEACNRHLSIPPKLHEIVKCYLMEAYGNHLDGGASTDTYNVDDLLELTVEALENVTKSCLATEILIFSRSALPQNVLLPKGWRISEFPMLNASANNSESMMTSLENIKLLLDELILHDEHRDGVLSIITVVHVLITWQMCIDSTSMASNGPTRNIYEVNARLIAQCFAIQENGESEVVDYIELIAFAHERIVEVTINSIEDLLDSMSTFERGLDCGTHRSLIGYIGDVVLDRRRGLGPIMEDRIRAANVRASKTPRSYVSKSITASSRRKTKTPIYLTEQHLYTEERRVE